MRLITANVWHMVRFNTLYALVCALHEHERTLTVSSIKSLNMQIYFDFKEKAVSVFFPEGESPLYAGVTPGKAKPSRTP